MQGARSKWGEGGGLSTPAREDVQEYIIVHKYEYTYGWERELVVTSE